MYFCLPTYISSPAPEYTWTSDGGSIVYRWKSVNSWVTLIDETVLDLSHPHPGKSSWRHHREETGAGGDRGEEEGRGTPPADQLGPRRTPSPNCHTLSGGATQ